MQQMITKHYYEEEERNKKVRGRMWFLLPYYVGTLSGLMLYSLNIKQVAKRFWPNRMKVTGGNLLLIGTVHAAALFTIYVPGTFLILGINPRDYYNEYKRQMDEELNLIAQSSIDLNGPKEQITNQVS